MLEVLYNNKWCSFHPLSSVVYGEEFDYRPLEELPNKVYGKILGGVCGYEPWWIFSTVEKNKLRNPPKKVSENKSK